MQLILQADCTRAYLDGRVSPSLIETIHHGLSFFDPGALRDWRFQSKQWDGRVYLFDPETLQFPAGLARRVRQLCLSHGVEPEIVDQRLAPPARPVIPLLDSKDGPRTLYEDQAQAFNAVFDRDDPCGVIVHPTGAGKTVLAAAFFKALYPQRCLFIVDQRGLMRQSASELSEALNERVGMIGDTRYRDMDTRVTVAVINSLYARIAVYARDLFPHMRVLFVDECHVISENMWHKVLVRIPSRVRIGLTATLRESPRRLVVESFLGPILFEGSAQELIDAGRLAKPDCYMLRVGGLLDDGLDLDVAYERAIVQHKARNRRIAAAAREFVRRGWPTVISVWLIDHGHGLQKLFADHDMRVPFIHGQSSLDEIDRVKRGLESGDIPCAIVSRIFDKGQNVPAIRALIMAGGNRSPLITIQRAGRALRKKTDDNRCVILDFLDYAHKTLRNQATERQRTMTRKYGSVKLINSIEEIAE